MPAEVNQSKYCCLPPEFVKRLAADPMMTSVTSHIETAKFHKSRLTIVSCKDDVGPDDVINKSDIDGPPNPSVHLGNRRTYLHYPAQVGDPLLACEMIRLGASINETPHSAGLLSHQSSITRRRDQRGIIYVIRTLVEQHADVNSCVDGVRTPLVLACRTNDWTLIEFMIRHGAKPNPQSLTNFLTLPADNARLEALLILHADAPRPPRLCPRFSSKTLAQCHTSEQPYPPHFICHCGSSKVFSRCCARLGRMIVYEEWNVDESWIQPAFRSVTLPFALSVAQDIDGVPYLNCSYQKKGPYTLSSKRNPCPDEVTLEEYRHSMRLTKRVIVEACPSGMIEVDPACLYALDHINGFPL
ncbi:hypothetical protein JAAARDRAFT_205715 [Jaapia argillacea MUCL 33604]|uniref:Uncharacterized protein n=1 Tax=Jaapia argillacea MUCL 33604 TaxID=933084 RepID=A0A067PYD9_9AGAM|nr:hypothetical protein JAAARDRAFT_205715 [Jaapia argillacea MUCL 33604]